MFAQMLQTVSFLLQMSLPNTTLYMHQYSALYVYKNGSFLVLTAGLHTNFFSWWPDRATKIINYQFLVARKKKVWNEWRQHSAPYDAKNKCRVFVCSVWNEWR